MSLNSLEHIQLQSWRNRPNWPHFSNTEVIVFFLFQWNRQ